MKFNPITTIIFHQHTLQPLYYMDWFGSHWTMHYICTTQRTSSGCSVRFITGLDSDTSTPAVLQRLDSQNINGEYFVFTHCCIWYIIVALKILKRKCWIFFTTSAFQPLLDFWNGYPMKWKCKNSNVDILVNSFFCLHCKQQHFLPL